MRGDDESSRPLRRFGQNFLADARVARRIVDAFAPTAEDRVVEIGPGRGALTAELAARAGRLVALELDERLVPGIARILEGHGGAEVRHADALGVDWDGLAEELGGPVRVIGNLPFNVGTAIVRRLLAARRVRDVQAMLQLEVAERLLASHGTKAYGPISVVAALRAERSRLAVLPAGVFRPRPKVRAAVVRLVVHDDAPLPVDEIAMLERWLFAGFAHRRKTLAGNLGGARERVRAFLETAGLPPDARAEAVPAVLWLELARALERGRGAAP